MDKIFLFKFFNKGYFICFTLLLVIKKMPSEGKAFFDYLKKLEVICLLIFPDKLLCLFLLGLGVRIVLQLCLEG